MRKPRQHSKTGLYHIVVRGVNRQNIFFDKEDKVLFLGLLKKYAAKYDIKIYAYCLLDNHVHLELEDSQNNVSIFMQCICSLYARIFNRKYDRIGHLFQERFASEIINDLSYFLTVFRYVLQNPVKAGLCKTVNYEWSSYKCYKNSRTFVKKKLLFDYFKDINKLNDFINTESEDSCLEIELRYSEREKSYIDKIKKILESNTPIIPPDLPKDTIRKKIKKLKLAGFSIRTIERVTGISKYLIQYS